MGVTGGWSLRVTSGCHRVPSWLEVKLKKSDDCVLVLGVTYYAE